MLWGVLWTIGIYAAVTASLHWAYRHSRSQHTAESEPAAVFALVTHNNEAEIEWYLRTLLFVCWLKGQSLAIIVFDDNSTDDTLAIVQRMAAEGSYPCVRIADVTLDQFLAEEQQTPAAVVIRSIGGGVMRQGEGCIIR